MTMRRVLIVVGIMLLLLLLGTLVVALAGGECHFDPIYKICREAPLYPSH